MGAYLSLDPDIEPLSPLHDCCSYCATMCKCGGMSCEVSVMPFEFTDYRLQTTNQAKKHDGNTREVTSVVCQDLRVALGEVFNEMKGHGLAIVTLQATDSQDS